MLSSSVVYRLISPRYVSPKHFDFSLLIARYYASAAIFMAAFPSDLKNFTSNVRVNANRYRPMLRRIGPRGCSACIARCTGRLWHRLTSGNEVQQRKCRYAEDSLVKTNIYART